MKTFNFFILTLGFMLMAGLSGCQSKTKSWSQAQKETWTTNCMKVMTDRGVDQKDAAGLCDCMLKKTSEKYSPEEAVNITPEQERQLWQECDYQW